MPGLPVVGVSLALPFLRMDKIMEITMGVEIGGLFGLIILIADIWAIVTTIQSPATTGVKVLWIVTILVLPILGLILWLLLGPRQRRG